MGCVALRQFLRLKLRELQHISGAVHLDNAEELGNIHGLIAYLHTAASGFLLTIYGRGVLLTDSRAHNGTGADAVHGAAVPTLEVHAAVGSLVHGVHVETNLASGQLVFGIDGGINRSTELRIICLRIMAFHMVFYVVKPFAGLECDVLLPIGLVNRRRKIGYTLELGEAVVISYMLRTLGIGVGLLIELGVDAALILTCIAVQHHISSVKKLTCIIVEIGLEVEKVKMLRGDEAADKPVALSLLPLRQSKLTSAKAHAQRHRKYYRNQFILHRCPPVLRQI